MDIEVIKQAIEYVFSGLGYTLLSSALAIALAMVLGVCVWMMLISTNRLVRGIAICYSKIFRCIPFMIQVYIIYYGLSTMRIHVPALVTGIIVLGIYNSAYIAMIFESGVKSIPKGQFESAKALNIPYFKTIFRIIIPQMKGVILPPLTSQFVTAVKDSSILSIITVCEMTMMANKVITITFSAFEVYVVVGIAYWIINIVIERIMRYIEVKKINYV